MQQFADEDTHNEKSSVEIFDENANPLSQIINRIANNPNRGKLSNNILGGGDERGGNDALLQRLK